MPNYDFVCPNCGAEYNDVKHSISEISLGVKCEKCGETLEVAHHSPIYFKLLGNGWTNKSK